MPAVLLLRSDLEKHLGISDREKLEELCFQYGLEYEEESRHVDGTCYDRIEVPSNRVDLLCLEGIIRSLNAYLGKKRFFPFHLKEKISGKLQCIHVNPSVVPLRPYCFGAVLRGIRFTESILKSFIDLQEKLHQNIARKRQLVAIGTHDLSTVEGPFSYETLPPESIVFRPLNHSTECNARDLMEILQDHTSLKAYLPLIRDSPTYPVIKDSKGTVLSLPPIINGDHSKVTLDTRDIFIEVTATDVVKGQIVLNILTSTFSQYCAEPYSIEPVQIVYHQEHPLMKGQTFINPSLKDHDKEIYSTCYVSRKTIHANVENLSAIAGIPHLSMEQVADLLGRMMIRVVPKDSVHFDAIIPISRPDILHECDLAEDVAVAYGYNKIVPCEYSSGSNRLMTCLSDMLRAELSQGGYHETLTWGLCSMREGYEAFGGKIQEAGEGPLEYHPFGAPILLENPKSREFQMVRVSLIPGLLKSLAANFAHELPLKFFEIGDCVTRDSNTANRSQTRRYCAALVANHSGSGLELVHGLLDHLLGCLGLSAVYHEYQNNTTYRPTASTEGDSPHLYRLVPFTEDDTDQSFLPGRGVHIYVSPENICVGRMGILNPTVLREFEVTLPCSVFEFSLTPFLRWISQHDL